MCPSSAWPVTIKVVQLLLCDPLFLFHYVFACELGSKSAFNLETIVGAIFSFIFILREGTIGIVEFINSTIEAIIDTINSGKDLGGCVAKAA